MYFIMWKLKYYISILSLVPKNANLYYSSKMLYYSSFEVQKRNWELARMYSIPTIAQARRDFYFDCIIASTSIDPFLLQKYWFVYIPMIISFSLSFAYFLCFWLFVCFPHFSMHVIYEPFSLYFTQVLLPLLDLRYSQSHSIIAIATGNAFILFLSFFRTHSSSSCISEFYKLWATFFVFAFKSLQLHILKKSFVMCLYLTNISFLRYFSIHFHRNHWSPCSIFYLYCTI